MADGRIYLDDATPLTGRQIVTLALTNAGAPLTIRSIADRLRSCRMDPRPVIAEMLTDGSMIPAYVGDRRDLVTYGARKRAARQPGPKRAQKRTASREKVYAALSEPQTVAGAAAIAGMSVGQTRKLIAALVKAGAVERVGKVKTPGVIKAEYVYRARS